MSRDIELVRSKRKTLVIEVTADARVIVRAPLLMPVSQINKFIGEKADWIDIHVRKMEEKQKKRLVQEQNPDIQPLSKQDINLLVTRAKRIIPQKVRHFAQLIDVTYGNITIRMQKSRWGSCSAKGNLNFNCLLMNAPDEIIDYVVVHELCHRKQMNHSPKFWSLVEQILPDYKDRRKWLKDHGSELCHK